MNQNLLQEVANLIRESINLRHLDASQFTPELALTQSESGQGLGLDSVDILELVVAVEKRFHVKIKDAETGKRVFRSVGSIVEFIESQNSSASPNHVDPNL